MNHKILLVFLISFTRFAWSMDFNTLDNTSQTSAFLYRCAQNRVHKNSPKMGVIDRTHIDSHHSDDLKRGHDFIHEFEEVILDYSQHKYDEKAAKTDRLERQMQPRGSAIKPS